MPIGSWNREATSEKSSWSQPFLPGQRELRGCFGFPAASLFGMMAYTGYNEVCVPWGDWEISGLAVGSQLK
jgi:hypothetical protein